MQKQVAQDILHDHFLSNLAKNHGCTSMLLSDAATLAFRAVKEYEDTHDVKLDLETTTKQDIGSVGATHAVAYLQNRKPVQSQTATGPFAEPAPQG
ncbi:MAG: hypothetical protein R3D66_05000 [Alphaproteobacteria bacterium]